LADLSESSKPKVGFRAQVLNVVPFRGRSCWGYHCNWGRSLTKPQHVKIQPKHATY